MIIYISPRLTKLKTILKQKFPTSTFKNIKDYERLNKIHSLARKPNVLALPSPNCHINDDGGSSL